MQSTLILQSQHIDLYPQLQRLIKTLQREGYEVEEGRHDTHTLRLHLHGPDTPRRELTQQLRQTLTDLPIDLVVCAPEWARGYFRLMLSDMDSTLISIECIDELADMMGIKPQIAAITERAMRGELDFAASLRERVALLAGLPDTMLDRVYQERLQLNPGAEQLIAGLKAQGCKTGVVSGGFTFFTERLKTRLGLDYAYANTLEIEAGKLTGRVVGDVFDAKGKADTLTRLAAENHLPLERCIAMGDGANDIPMLREAGLAVAYHAKPVAELEADICIRHGGLDVLLGMLNR